MELWSVLFSDWVGIASFLVIAFMLAMGGWFAWYFITNMSQATAAEVNAANQSDGNV